jgi:hypothetical protein
MQIICIYKYLNTCATININDAIMKTQHTTVTTFELPLHVIDLPFVSLCTPTFNRRPFIPYLIKCIENQTYPKDKMEWIIVDDGTDKIEDLVAHLPYVKYYKSLTRMLLGKKRNVMHDKCNGSIIVYMDDDDYYPEERVQHAVEMLLANPEALCAGSSEMHIYFSDLKQMYQCGPYGLNHSTAATFAFRKELLKEVSYNDNEAIAEEKHFLRNYTIPFVQLNTEKTILVFAHIHNSVDKKMIINTPTACVKKSDKRLDDFFGYNNKELKQFYSRDLNDKLLTYPLGKPENKPETLQQIELLTNERKKRAELHETMTKDMIEMKKSHDKVMENKDYLISVLLKQNKELKETNKTLQERLDAII